MDFQSPEKFESFKDFYSQQQYHGPFSQMVSTQDTTASQYSQYSQVHRMSQAKHRANPLLRLPAIVLDIDGVLLKGRTIVGNSPLVVRSLLEPYSERQVGIPFVLMTNGGGLTEPDKAIDINSKLGLRDDEARLSEEHMILCHTPLRDPNMLRDYHDKLVLITGKYEELDVALFYGYQYAIHIEELALFYSDEIPNDLPLVSPEKLAMYRANLLRRFGKTPEQIELNFAAIFVIFGVTFSSATLQILCDILGSKNGHPKGPRREVYQDGSVDRQVVHFYCTNNDLVWPNTFPVPRFGTCMFTTCLEALFTKYYGYPLQICYFGKPEKPTFDYCERMLRERADLQGVDISRIYMIGDTPESDIKGANGKKADGWVSVLVKTGLSSENSKVHPADLVFEDVLEAVRYIYQIEGVDRDITLDCTEYMEQ